MSTHPPSAYERKLRYLGLALEVFPELDSASSTTLPPAVLFHTLSAPARRLPWWLSGSKIFLQSRRCRRHRFNPWVRKIPWRRTWQPTPVFLPGESHRQRSLKGYGPRVAKSWTRLKRPSVHAPWQQVLQTFWMSELVCSLGWTWDSLIL